MSQSIHREIEVTLRRLDRVEEVLLSERELYDNYARLEPLQVFLNLTFDKVGIDYYSLRKYKVCVECSIHVHFQLFYVLNFHLTKQSN